MATAVVMVCLVALHCSGITAAPVSGQVFVATEDTYAQTLGWLKTHGYYKGQIKKDMKIDDLKAAIQDPLKAMKEFYGHYPINGDLTADVMKTVETPRCGHSDEDEISPPHGRTKRFTKLSNAKWENMPVTISFNNYARDFTRTEQIDIALECARMWASESSLSFALADSGELGNIAIEFVRIDGPWRTVGKGLSAVPFGRPPSSYLKLDVDEPWKKNSEDGARDKVSLRWALCHEMGHTLSIGHSRDQSAIMYPSGTGKDDSRLGYDDIRGVQDIYGRSNGRTIVSSQGYSDYQNNRRSSGRSRERQEERRNRRQEEEEKRREEEERRAREEAQRRAREEADRRAREEADRRAREEADRRAKEEAERRAREDAERRERDEAERREREEEEREREEADRRAREEAEQREREAAEKREQEEAARREQEADREDQEEAAKRAAEEEAARRAAEEAASDREAQEDAERQAAEELERREQEDAARRAREEEEQRYREEAEQGSDAAPESRAVQEARENLADEKEKLRLQQNEVYYTEQELHNADRSDTREIARLEKNLRISVEREKRAEDNVARAEERLRRAEEEDRKNAEKSSEHTTPSSRHPPPNYVPRYRPDAYKTYQIEPAPNSPEANIEYWTNRT